MGAKWGKMGTSTTSRTATVARDMVRGRNRINIALKLGKICLKMGKRGINTTSRTATAGRDVVRGENRLKWGKNG